MNRIIPLALGPIWLADLNGMAHPARLAEQAPQTKKLVEMISE